MRFRFIVFLGIILTVFSSNSYTWYAVCVDTLSYSGTDIEVDSLGYPHIIYHQSGKGLTYARWDGAQWLYECVEESLVIKGRAYIGKTYLELDTQGYPHISMPGPTYIWKDIIGWHKEDLPIPYNHNNHYTCLKLDSTDHPHIVYNLLEYWFWQSGPMSQTIWETDVVHHCYDGSNWHKKVVASDWEEKWCWDWMHCEHSGGQVGNLGASIALHNDDTFHIAYSSDQYYESMDKIIYKCMDTSWTPFSEFVDSANSPRISIEVDSQNRPFIVYQDFVSGLWISKRENGIWNTEPVGEEGKGFAFLLDSLDKPFITYGNDSQVRIARNRFGGWNKETIDSTTDNALSVMSLGIAIDRYGYIHISYPRSENSVWYATTSPIFASVSWSVSPESIQINTQTGVIVAVKDSSGNSYPGVEIHIRGYGVDLYDTTDISGEAILNVDAPYGEQLQVVGRDTNNQKELFTEFLPVYGGSELFSPDIGAYSDTIGVSDGMMIDIPGTVWGYAQETGYTLYLKGCGIDTSHYTSGDSIKIELIPTEVGDMMCAIGKSGYNIYQDAVRVKIYKGWLSGYVLDSSTSDSLINVHIKGYEVGVDTSVSDPVFNITTNIYGFYEVGDSIPCGDYDVYSNVFGYQPSLEVVTIKHGDNMHNVEMLIGSSGIISGTIKERGSGDPLTSEINIYRTDSSFYKIYKIKKSDSLSGGVYSVRLPLSTFRFVVSSYGHIPMYTPVSLDTDSLELNFVMDTILGTILIIDDSGTKGIISSREAEFTKGGLPEKKGSPSSSRAGSAATKFYNWLTGVGYYVDTTTTALTDTSDWALYDFLVVSSGSYLAPLNSNDITNKLIDWIDNDGKLLIEGGEVGYDWRETTFGSTVLHITGWHSDNAGNLPKQDTTHPLTTILNILPDSLFITYSGYGDEDAVILNDNANLIYGTRDYLSDAGILVYDPTPPIESGQIVYYAFNLDALQDTVAARHLVENTAFYFYTSEPPGPDTLYGNVNLIDTSYNEGAVVIAKSGAFCISDTTDTNGDYLLNLYDGIYEIIVLKEGYLSSVIRDVTINGNLRMDFTLHRSRLRILVIKDSYSEKEVKESERRENERIIEDISSIITNGRSGESADKFIRWLREGGYYVDTTNSQNTNPDTWLDNDFIVWSAGANDKSLQDFSMRNALKEYVNNGHKLLIEGGHLADEMADLDPGFIIDILHGNDDQGDSAGPLVSVDSTHPIKNTPWSLPDILFLNYTHGTNEVSFDQDIVDPASDAHLVYGTMQDREVIGINVYDPTPPIESGQIVYYAFNLDALQDTVAARHLVENTAFYFYTSEPPGPDTLYGNVNLFDTSDNGGVVVTARLSGYVCTDTTGESGDYMIPNLFDGLYEITASKEGYMDSILSDFNITGNHQMGFTLCPLVVLYEEDFESDNGGYTGTGDWQCGIPNSGPQVAHSGERLWATNLSGDYSNSSNSMLTTVEIDLSSVMGFPILSFYQWYHIEGYYDGGNVKISVNEGSWEILDSLSPPYNVDVAYWENTGIPGEPCYSGSQEAWKEIKKDLSAYRGNTIRIRFHFGSDGLRKYTGWYIDDITVYYGKRVSEEIPSVYSMTIDGVTIGDEFNIRYALPEKGEVVLTVYDIAGRVVRRICEIKEAGWYQTNINMQGMSSSVYFIKIKAGSFTKTKKSVFLH